MLLGVAVSLAPMHLIGMALLIVLGAGLFSTLSLIIACLVKTRERFMGIGQVITMPIFFASNALTQRHRGRDWTRKTPPQGVVIASEFTAIYPLEIMPTWLRALARANPLTYEVDALRALMIRGANSVFGIGTDFAVLGIGFAILVIVAARLYGRMGS